MTAHRSPLLRFRACPPCARHQLSSLLPHITIETGREVKPFVQKRKERKVEDRTDPAPSQGSKRIEPMKLQSVFCSISIPSRSAKGSFLLRLQVRRWNQTGGYIALEGLWEVNGGLKDEKRGRRPSFPILTATRNLKKPLRMCNRPIFQSVRQPILKTAGEVKFGEKKVVVSILSPAER